VRGVGGVVGFAGSGLDRNGMKLGEGGMEDWSWGVGGFLIGVGG